MKNKFLFLFLFLIFFILIFFFLKNTSKSDYFIINDKVLKVDIAFNQKEHELGLSGRKNIPKNYGLLFVFSEPAIYGFWMKDMLFPIDIIWLNADFQIVYFQENVQPVSFPEIFKNTTPALYVLEVSANFIQENNLTLNQKLNFYPKKTL